MPESSKRTRREILSLSAGVALSLITGEWTMADASVQTYNVKGHIKQSVSRWCFGGFSLDDLCEKSKAMGLVGLDLLGENEWDTVHNHGLVCTMASGIGGISDCWNRIENHDKLIMDANRLIPLAASKGITNIITFSGNRKGISDAEGMDNCARGLERIMNLAEKNKMMVIMELLNSKRDHKDYQCDHTAWGVQLAKKVGSTHFKLLYDIYHMQIMEGDLCNEIRENIEYIGHFHTGGVPGRNEIDDSQEIYYPRVMKTILETGYKGYVAHEFIPKRDPMSSLLQGIKICDI